MGIPVPTIAAPIRASPLKSMPSENIPPSTQKPTILVLSFSIKSDRNFSLSASFILGGCFIILYTLPPDKENISKTMSDAISLSASSIILLWYFSVYTS